MKKFLKNVFALLCAAVLVVPVLAACNSGDKEGENEEFEHVDYVSQLKLDMTSETKKQEVTVRAFVDGDTTHFDPIDNIAEFAETDGYIKARYLAINTPESTGKVEKWGKSASIFTHEKLDAARAPGGSIIVESDDGQWNIDSTGSRYLLWVWYKLPGETDYRNLNVEILQNGYALASATASNRYGTIAVAALEQAQREKLHVFSTETDPNFYEGDAVAVSLKELRCHIKDYELVKVRVEGVVTADFDDSVYIEDYDEETGLYFGIVVYYGKTASAAVKTALDVGNEVSVVGTVQYYETGGTYQISGVSANLRNPSFDTDTIVIGTGTAGFAETEAKDIISGKVTASFSTGEDEEGNETFEDIELAYGEAIMNTTVSLKNLKVKSTYTTATGTSKGAISLTCEAEDGTTITIRTTVISSLTEDQFKGKTINVKGIVDYYSGSYQVKVHRADYITILD